MAVHNLKLLRLIGLQLMNEVLKAGQTEVDKRSIAGNSGNLADGDELSPVLEQHCGLSSSNERSQFGEEYIPHGGERVKVTLLRVQDFLHRR